MSDSLPQGSAGSRVAQGGLVMALRQVLVGIAAVIAGVVLSRQLTEAEFGVYGLLTIVMTASYLLVEAGFSAAVVQRKDEPRADELRAVFGAQLLLAMVGALAVVAVSRFIGSSFSQVPHARASLALSGVGLLLIPLVTPAVIRLERDLRLAEAGTLMAIKPLVFYAGAAALTACGAGVLGLAVAFLLSNAAMIPFALWRTGALPTPSTRFKEISPLIKFASYNWLGSSINVAKDAVNPIILGYVLGATSVGRVNWAQQLAVLGTYLVAVFARLLLPAFAKLQHDASRLADVAGRTGFYLTCVTAPVVAAMVVSADHLVSLLYGNRWESTIPLFLILSVANCFTPLSLISSAILTSTGKPQLVMFAAAGWASITWAFAAALVAHVHIYSYGIANVAAQGVTVWMTLRARRVARFAIFRPFVLPWMISFACFGAARFLVAFMPLASEWLEFILCLLLGALLCAGGLATVGRREFMWIWVRLRSAAV